MLTSGLYSTNSSPRQSIVKILNGFGGLCMTYALGASTILAECSRCQVEFNQTSCLIPVQDGKRTRSRNPPCSSYIARRNLLLLDFRTVRFAPILTPSGQQILSISHVTLSILMKDCGTECRSRVRWRSHKSADGNPIRMDFSTGGALHLEGVIERLVDGVDGLKIGYTRQ